MRIPVTSTLSVLALGLAAAFVAPSLMSGPRGEPILVADPGAAMLRKASFEGTACPGKLVRRAEAGLPQVEPGLESDGAPTEINPQRELAVVVFFDVEGRLRAAKVDRTMLEQALVIPCDETPHPAGNI